MRHDRCVRDLVTLNGRWSDWQVNRWDISGLRLTADNDLTYHHHVEVTFVDVVWVSCADLFHHPVFRPPTATELMLVRGAHDDPQHASRPVSSLPVGIPDGRA
jgi:hypothetical protein